MSPTPAPAATSAPRCRVESADLPLAGTAPRADAWWCVHLPRPWGPRVIDETAAAQGVELSTARDVDRGGGIRRIVAVRRPREVNTGVVPTSFTVWVAGTRPGDPSLRVVDHATWGELATWSGRFPPTDRLRAAGADAPWLAVCTNGRRDPCCAEAGRRLIDATSSIPGVWESSHLGGHRFAPTALDLRTGYCYGRLGVSQVELLSETARVVPESARGRTCLSPAEQAADTHLRIVERLWAPDEVRVVQSGESSPGAATTSVVLEHGRTGRRWQVSVQRRDVESIRVSCQGMPEAVPAHGVVSMEALA